MQKLPLMPRLDVFTLRKTIEKGVKNAIQPWQVAADLPPETSENILQGVYNVMVQETTDAILQTFIHEYLIS